MHSDIADMPAWTLCMQGAVNRVANHNFVGDESEPKVYPVNDGFKGDIHSGHGAERDG